MKQFFFLVFGGLAAISVGIFVTYSANSLWKTFTPKLSGIQVSSINNLASSVLARAEEGTAIQGMKRTVSYTAIDEEDVISAVVRTLPVSYAENVTAKAYLVKNLNTSIAAIDHNSEKLLPIASLTKLVTAVVTRKLIPQDKIITLNKEVVSTYGNTGQFKIGEKISAGSLLYPLLMVSSNDAAEALASAYGRKKFIEAMNEFTQSIGAYRTYFDDPSGLSPANVSTANDLSLIIDWIRLNDPTIISITQLKSKTVKPHIWVNPTHFLSWSNYAGGKNGYTPEANRTAVSLFNVGKNKDPYAVILLGSESRDADEMKLLKKLEVRKN